MHVHVHIAVIHVHIHGILTSGRFSIFGLGLNSGPIWYLYTLYQSTAV